MELIEHRCSQRRKMSLDVVLNYHSLGLVHGQTRDLSMGGMFVETGRIQLPVHAQVDISLILESEGCCPPPRFEAMVVHDKGAGIGLMFNHPDSTGQDVLRQLIDDLR